VESVGLNFVSFDNPKERLKYGLENVDIEEDLKGKIMKFKKRDKQAIAEIIDGSIIGHHFFVSKLKDSTAALQDEIVPFIFGNPVGLQQSLEKHNFQAKCTYEKTEFNLKLPLTENLHHFLGLLFNYNKSTFVELSNRISEAHDIQEEDLKHDFKSFYDCATKHDIVLLRHKNTGSQSVGQVGRGFGLFMCS
jgi:hypothetical protein